MEGSDHQVSEDTWIDQISRLVISYSVNLRPQDVILISGNRACRPLVDALFKVALLSKGLPVVHLGPQPALVPTLRCVQQVIEEEGGALANPFNLPDASTLDCLVGISCKLVDDLQPSDAAVISPIGGGSSDEHFREFLRLIAEGGLRWTNVFCPTEAAARCAGMSAASFHRLYANACFLDCNDPQSAWRRVSESQTRICEYLAGIREIHILTPDGTDLTVCVEGRSWENCDGRMNLPGGEVFTTPVANAVHGVFRPRRRQKYASTVLNGVHLKFEDGVVTEAFAYSGQELLLKILTLFDGTPTVGELGFGTNDRIICPTGLNIFDEKRIGSFHIALGASIQFPEEISSSCEHWDLTEELGQGSVVETDGRVFIENGHFCLP